MQKYKVKAGFISFQSDLSNCAALTVCENKPYLPSPQTYTYLPALCHLFEPRNLITKLLQAKFPLYVSPFVCCKRNYTKHKSNFTCCRVCWGAKALCGARIAQLNICSKATREMLSQQHSI